LAKQASEFRITQFRPPVSVQTAASSIILTVTAPRTYVLGNCYGCGKPGYQKHDYPAFTKKVGLVVDVFSLKPIGEARPRRGILSEEEGDFREADIGSLDLQYKRKLLERLVKVAEENNEKFLLKLKNRIDRVGIEILTIEVRFDHLNITTEAHVGGRALPLIVNFSMNMIDVSGKVTYNCHGMDEFVPQRSSAYISQYDLHIGEMTLRETLAFAARCQGPGTGYEMLAELSRREKAANIKPDPDIDVYMKAAALEGQEASVVTDYILKSTFDQIMEITVFMFNMLTINNDLDAVKALARESSHIMNSFNRICRSSLAFDPIKDSKFILIWIQLLACVMVKQSVKVCNITSDAEGVFSVRDAGEHVSSVTPKGISSNSGMLLDGGRVDNSATKVYDMDTDTLDVNALSNNHVVEHNELLAANGVIGGALDAIQNRDEVQGLTGSHGTLPHSNTWSKEMLQLKLIKWCRGIGNNKTLVLNVWPCTSLKLQSVSCHNWNACVTFVYAKYEVIDRRSLWDDLISLSNGSSEPWLIAGDFNAIRCNSRKIVKRLRNPSSMREFEYMIQATEILEVNYVGYLV
ncbi:hypothetical protein GIB67_016421, partial [Kingdonia uniflora]